MNFELFKARKQTGLTQEQVAEKVGIRRERYNQIELGKTKPDYDEAVLISQVVNKKPEELFAVCIVDDTHNNNGLPEAANV